MAVDEATELLENWFKDDTNGLSSLIDGVPRKPEDPRPKTPTIYSDLSSEEIANDQPPPEPISVVIVADSDGEADVQSNRPAHEFYKIRVALMLVTRDVTVLDGRRDGKYILRAIMRGLRRLHDSRDPNFKELLGYKIIKIVNITEQRVTGQVGQSALHGMVTATLHLQDQLP